MDRAHQFLETFFASPKMENAKPIITKTLAGSFQSVVDDLVGRAGYDAFMHDFVQTYFYGVAIAKSLQLS